MITSAGIIVVASIAAYLMIGVLCSAAALRWHPPEYTVEAVGAIFLWPIYLVPVVLFIPVWGLFLSARWLSKLGRRNAD